jgi:hypothetical protein
MMVQTEESAELMRLNVVVGRVFPQAFPQFL